MKGKSFANSKEANEFWEMIKLPPNIVYAEWEKLSKEEKIQWLANEYFSNPSEATNTIKQYWNSDEKLQQLHDEFIENTITNFYLPIRLSCVIIIWVEL